VTLMQSSIGRNRLPPAGALNVRLVATASATIVKSPTEPRRGRPSGRDRG